MIYKKIKLFLLIILFAGPIIISKNQFFNNKIKTNNINSAQQVTYVSENIDIKEKYKTLVDQYKNEDIIGTISIKNLFNSIIVKTTDNKYYLDHNLKKEYNILGNPFLDYREELDDKQINIYGHNSIKYDVPFKKLLNYLNYDFYKENKYIIFETKNTTYKYEIIGVSITNDNEHIKIDFNSQDEFSEHINKLINNNLYKTTANYVKEDKILILQTCIFNNEDGKYLIVVAKQI